MAEQSTEVKTASGVLKEKSPEIAESLSKAVSSLGESLANTLLNMPEDQQKKMLDALRSLNDGIFARGASENLKKPEMVLTAIKGAASLVSPEPQQRKEAQQMVDSLKNRYSLK